MVQVGDIYGGDYPAIGLKGTTIASSFGKLQTNCPTTLKPANLCPVKWVKQTHHRRRKRLPVIPSLPPSSSEHSVQNGSTDLSSDGTSTFVSPRSSPIQNPIQNPIHNSSVPFAQPDKPSIPQISALNCGDPLCCCCGLQRWAYCETSEASAAAAVGILEETQAHLIQSDDLSEFDEISTTPCDLAFKTQLLEQTKGESASAKSGLVAQVREVRLQNATRKNVCFTANRSRCCSVDFDNDQFQRCTTGVPQFRYT